MKYSSPECSVYVSVDVVRTSIETDATVPSGSGGIQLPFIPG